MVPVAEKDFFATAYDRCKDSLNCRHRRSNSIRWSRVQIYKRTGDGVKPVQLQ